MGTQTDYFERIGYRPKYTIGDRVFGNYQKIPFVGSVGNDRLVSESTGPEVTIHLDLPIKTPQGIHNIIIVKHKNIKPLLNYDNESVQNRRKK